MRARIALCLGFVLGWPGCLTVPSGPAGAPQSGQGSGIIEPVPDPGPPAELGAPAELGDPGTWDETGEGSAPVFPPQAWRSRFRVPGLVPAGPRPHVGMPYWAYTRRPTAQPLDGASLTGELEVPSVQPVRPARSRRITEPPATRQALPRVEELAPPPAGR